MGLEEYEYQASEDHLDFEFYSEGPRGKIRKIVRYRKKYAGSITYFNLGFGDWNAAAGKIDDLAISNNHDKRKVLGTVASTVLEFTRYFPGALVYAQGSTGARTRMYQIGISLNWHNIEPLLNVFGYRKGVGWELFLKNRSYEAFLIRRK